MATSNIATTLHLAIDGELCLMGAMNRVVHDEHGCVFEVNTKKTRAVGNDNNKFEPIADFKMTASFPSLPFAMKSLS